ncbi:MAG: carbohydrate binding domain-containing protein, partial [Bacteroidota bacterium]
SFNQILSNWCVGAIPYEPIDFNLVGQISPEFLPRWGECKELDENGNLVLNANFEQRNVYQDWDLWLADWEVGNVNFYEENGQLILDNISSAGSQSWSIQINQYISASQNARLEVGGIYRLRFEAVSNSERPLKVWMGLNEEPWTPVLEEFFTIDGELDFYEVEFIMEEKFDNMKLGFEFGTSDVPAALDNISLEKIGQVDNDQNIVTYGGSNPSEFDALKIYFDATRGGAQLRDDNNDSFENVYIYTGVITNLSNNDSEWRYVQSNWEDLPDRLKMTKTDQNWYEFTFEPSIREFFGIQDQNESILKIAMVFQGLSYDENGNQVIVKGSDYYDGDILLDLTATEQNIIVNGNFALEDSAWVFELNTTGNIDIIDEELAFTGLDASGNVWDVQAHQYFDPSLLEVGANYRVSFDARTAEGTHDIHVFLGEVGGNWSRYFQPEPGDGIIKIDEEMKRYHLYTSVEQVWETMRLGFEVNYEPGDVFIDNVSLVKVDQIPSSDYIASVHMDTMLSYSPEITVTIYADDILLEDMVESYNLILPYEEGLSYMGVATAETHSEDGILSINDTGTSLQIGFAANGYLSGSMPLIHLGFNAEAARDYHFNLDELIFNNIYNQNNEGGLIGVVRKVGDVDNDDHILAYDAAKVLKYSVGLDPMPDEDPLPWDLWRTGTADVNFDGLILASDAADILKHSVGLIDEFSSIKGKVSKPEVIAYVSDKVLHLEASGGGLFALNIHFEKNESMTFLEPSTTSNALLASNITETYVKIGMASSEELTGNFLTIP